MELRFANDAFEAGHVSGKNGPAKTCQAVISTTRVVIIRRRRSFFDHPLIHHFLKVVVKGAGSEFVLPVGLPGNFLHDSVSVTILAGKSEKNMERCRRKGKKRTQILGHSRYPLYRIPSYTSRGLFNVPSRSAET